MDSPPLLPGALLVLDEDLSSSEEALSALPALRACCSWLSLLALAVGCLYQQKVE